MTGKALAVSTGTGLVKNVEELRVFQLAYEASLVVHRASLGFPKIEQYDLASQMRRASKSICSNLAEGYEKQQFSKTEFKRFLGIALGSCGEMKLWTRYAADLGYLPAEEARSLAERYRSIARMLQKLHQTSGHPVIRSSGHPRT